MADHTGPCDLDFDETGNFLVCAVEGKHQYNLKRAVNRDTVIVQLYHCGQLRPHGWAWRVAREKIGADQDNP